MDGRHRLRNWVIVFLGALAVPVLAYFGMLLAIGLGLSGAY